MRVISLSDPPYKRRPNKEFDAQLLPDGSPAERLLKNCMDRILRAPKSFGNVSVEPKGTRHCHLGKSGILWWKVHEATKEVEFLSWGDWDDYFG